MDSEKGLNLLDLADLFSDEERARKFIESRRWSNGRFCPRCGCDKSYVLTAKKESKSPVRKGVYKCKDCRKQFTVRIGTIFEESKLPLRKWLCAIHLFVTAKKGVSAKQLERQIGVTYKTAWFLSHRLREAMKQKPLADLLGGKGKKVEADETYVGEKPRRDSRNFLKGRNKRGRGSSKKTPVAILVERNGKVKAKPVSRVTAKELNKFIDKNVDVESMMVTDEFKSYARLKERFKGGHSVVCHSKGSYVNNQGEHTNTAESFNAIIKRGHYGIYHHFSKKHLHRYINEFAYRWNTRELNDEQRMNKTIKDSFGKRLKYKDSKK